MHGRPYEPPDDDEPNPIAAKLIRDLRASIDLTSPVLSDEQRERFALERALDNDPNDEGRQCGWCKGHGPFILHLDTNEWRSVCCESLPRRYPGEE